jgi:hypothetical protein
MERKEKIVCIGYGTRKSSADTISHLEQEDISCFFYGWGWGTKVGFIAQMPVLSVQGVLPDLGFKAGSKLE